MPSISNFSATLHGIQIKKRNDRINYILLPYSVGSLEISILGLNSKTMRRSSCQSCTKRHFPVMYVSIISTCTLSQSKIPSCLMRRFKIPNKAPLKSSKVMEKINALGNHGKKYSLYRMNEKS